MAFRRILESDATREIARERAAAEALEDLLGHSRAVFLLCFGLTRNRGDAEDLAQEAYLRAWRRLDRAPEGEAAKAWLCRIARNVCIDHLRRRRLEAVFRRAKPPDPPRTADDPHEDLARRERAAALSRALRRLPARLRDVLVLREYGELSYEQIAQALEIEPGTVMSRLHRARRRLAETVRASGARP
jgi:RNA polymerase sigma-70 factor, ECF subfamily